MPDRLAALRTALALPFVKLHDAYVARRAHASRFAERVGAIAGPTLAGARRALVRVLFAIERPLLTRAGRERVHAGAVFALIFAFAITSVDFLITGGPDFDAPQQSARIVPVEQIAATSLRTTDGIPIRDGVAAAQDTALSDADHVPGLDASALLGAPGATFAAALPARGARAIVVETSASPAAPVAIDIEYAAPEHEKKPPSSRS